MINLEEIKKKLLKEREEITKLLSYFHKEAMEIIKEPASATDELADKYEVKQETHLQEDILKARLKKINKALRKVEQNKYGICEKCHNKIEEARLKIEPTADYCRKCFKSK